MQKTTIYLDSNVQRILARLARSNGKTQSAVIRDAVLAYGGADKPLPKPASVASFHSGRHDLSRRCEELLDGFGKD